ncbi:M23 family metallopeptidase [Qipengyuania marisflavi]|uniref:M23 family metallopeptidase n=1 Tax=Qipengyuania marisflavi TaxID=2486356 RepID=A0A5S3PXC9_9SPHN|nr:M23 family metallopeptidase [Qipengyuania marisflavi]TMM48255.1 M23 family metallopeptidase [Qipengyuania marisflavi]
MIISRVAPLLALALVMGCAVPDGQPEEPATTAAPSAVVQPVRASPTPAPTPTPVAHIQPTRPGVFSFSGELTQGGYIRGTAPGGAVSVTLGGQTLPIDDDGHFFAAFDRDAGPSATLSARLADGRTIDSPLSIAPRAWNIERVNVARSPGGASEAFMRIRRPELARIVRARAVESDTQGWRQDFVWPVTGRISGRFGSQRVYRGEPGSYHSGLDVTTGRAGSPYVAPADGVVVLATSSDFSLEGKLLIIDHGNGLNSAFLHSSRLYVQEGERVKQGQHIGDIGSSGRATGPHLHWSLKWRDARLDPLLFTGPMN